MNSTRRKSTIAPRILVSMIAVLCLLDWAPVGAWPEAKPPTASALELISEVNDLRTSRGLPAYAINSILMSVAQSHSDYQASVGSVTHYGRGGSRPFQRALDASYPVAGDLSLGGFFSENIMAGSDLSAQSLVNAWMGDDPHLGTMTSPNLSEVGAGVSCAGNYCYYTLDAAQPTGGSVIYTPAVDSTPAAGATVVVVNLNTPASDGSTQHTVQAGETLWSISQAYGVSVEDIQQANHMSSHLIFAGNVLIIQPAKATSTPTTVPSGTPAPTYTPFVFWTVTPMVLATPTRLSAVAEGGEGGNLVVVVIIVVALVMAGILTAAGSRKPQI